MITVVADVSRIGDFLSPMPKEAEFAGANFVTNSY